MYTLATLPEILRRGELYRTLAEENQNNLDVTVEELNIPTNMITDNFTIENMSEFIKVFSIVTYWILDITPIEIHCFSLLYRHEVLAYLNKQVSTHCLLFKEDLLLNKSILLRKQEILIYANTRNLSESHMIQLLSDTTDFDIIFGNHTRDHQEYVRCQYVYSIINNKSLNFGFKILVNDIRLFEWGNRISKFSDDYSAEHQLSSIRELNDLANAIEIYENFRSKKIHYDKKSRRLHVGNKSLQLTSVSKYKIISALRNFSDLIHQHVKDLFPLYLIKYRMGLSIDNFAPGPQYERVDIKDICESIKTLSHEEFIATS
jgi:hypothetical protein